jgi:hypothetical protein
MGREWLNLDVIARTTCASAGPLSTSTTAPFAVRISATAAKHSAGQFFLALPLPGCRITTG